MVNQNGVLTNALYGFCRICEKICSDDYDGIIFVFVFCIEHIAKQLIFIKQHHEKKDPT